jgi:GNAT superfamily N-acetyltransferase
MTTVIRVLRPTDPPDPGPTQWQIGPVRPDDGPALHALFARCSPESIRQRFFGLLHELPQPYLEQVLAGRPDQHDAVVARGSTGLLALASLASGPGAPELAVLVADCWQRRGLGTALVELLLERARGRGSQEVSVCVLPERRALLAALTRRLEPVRGRHDAYARGSVYRLVPAEAPAAAAMLADQEKHRGDDPGGVR